MNPIILTATIPAKFKLGVNANDFTVIWLFPTFHEKNWLKTICGPFQTLYKANYSIKT